MNATTVHEKSPLKFLYWSSFSLPILCTRRRYRGGIERRSNSCALVCLPGDSCRYS